MSDEKEISAIDAIYQILDRIGTMEKRLHVIDDNVKILSNKVTKALRDSGPTAVEAKPRVVAPVAKNNSPQKSSSQQKVEKLLLGNVRVFGYIVNKGKHPLEDVQIKVFDDESRVVKNNKTNSDGYWEVRLPPGRYGVEYIHKNFKPINRTIELSPEIKEYEIR
jgi:hypothetical protein